MYALRLMLFFVVMGQFISQAGAAKPGEKESPRIVFVSFVGVVRANAADPDEKEPIRISPRDLYNAVFLDKENGEARFSGKVLHIIGKVTRVVEVRGSDPRQLQVFFAVADNERKGVHCRFNPKESRSIAALKQGDTILVEGYVAIINIVTPSVFLNQCMLLEKVK